MDLNSSKVMTLDEASHHWQHSRAIAFGVDEHKAQESLRLPFDNFRYSRICNFVIGVKSGKQDGLGYTGGPGAPEI